MILRPHHAALSVGMLALCAFTTRVAQAEPPIAIELWGLVEARCFHGTFEAIREFERRNPDIRVVVGTPGGQGDLDPQKLLTAFVSGTPPDVIWLSRHNMGLWVSRQAFMPLDALIVRDGMDLSEFYPGPMAEAQREGHTYAVPWNVDCRVLFSNRTLLQTAGYQRPPATWAELREYTQRMTRYDEVRGRYSLLGFAPNFGNSWLVLYAWQCGAEFFSQDGRHVRLTESPVEAGLQFMVEMSDLVGGAEKVQAFQGSAQIEGVGDPFLSDRLAMQINGNYYMETIARVKPDMDFVVTPPPAPRAGDAPMSWSGGFSWVIPAHAKHAEAAWKFMRWMNTEEAWIVQSEAQKAYAIEELGPSALSVPLFSANRALNERISVRYMAGLPESFRQANQVCLELLPNCRFLPRTPVSGEFWDAQTNAILDATFHVRTVRGTLELQQERVQAALNRIYEPAKGVIIPVRTIVYGVITFVVAAAMLLGGWFGLRLRGYNRLERWQAWQGLAYVFPWMTGFVLLTAGPMLFSLAMAFTRYDVLHPPEWIGLGNWVRMFGFHETGEGWRAVDPQFWHGLWNTAYIVLFGVPLGLTVSLGIALLLDRQVRGMRFYRTLFYIPAMTPVVAASFVFIWLLNPDSGLVNYLLSPLLHRIGLTAPGWFADTRWAKPGIILLITWGCGGTVIVWLAGLQSLPKTLYEAARIDGAGAGARFWHITLPLLTPYALFLWIMGTIGCLQVFTQAYLVLMNNQSEALLFYALYLFFRAFRYFEMGYACAMAWVLFTITAGVCLLQWQVSRRYVHYEGL